MISDFNRRITINRYEFSQNSAGGNIALPLSSWDLWAKVETTNGSRALDNAQVSYSKTFRVTVRAELSRPIYSDDEIVYLNDRLIIQSITRQKEGRVDLLEISAYTTNEQTLLA